MKEKKVFFNAKGACITLIPCYNSCVMGLDQCGKVKSPEGEVEEIAYWRKFNSLHGWMESLYRVKGGSEEFNCVPVELTEMDLEMLELAVKSGNLPETSGFFFGDPAHEREDYPDLVASVLDFIQEARKYLSQGYDVAYDSWW